MLSRTVRGRGGIGWAAAAAVALAATAAAAGTGLIFVSNEKSSTISILDGNTNAVIRTIETCARPLGHAFQQRQIALLRGVRRR